MRLQKIYWKYSRPLYCELIPTPPARRILVVSPHIDDDVIGCGGVLAQHIGAGATVASLYLRDGGATREAEAHEAAKLIGISDLIFLRWPKSDVWMQPDRIGAFRDIVERAAPDIVYAPFFLDPHPDHAAATRLLVEAADRGTAIGQCYLYEVWSPLVPNALVDITGQAPTKRQLINTHRSQVADIDMAQGVLGLNAYRAEMNRVHGYAEAFLRLRPNELARMLCRVDRNGEGTTDA